MTAGILEAQQLAWAPQPGPQEAACACPVPDIFFGGERGGGKTDWLVGDFANHVQTYKEHARGILFRRTYKELDEIAIRTRAIYPKLGGRFLSSKDDFRWVFPSLGDGSLVLRHMQQNKDADLYEGHQYTWQGFDQVEKWPSPEPVDKLWGSLRSAHGVPCVRRMTGNPPAPMWLRDRYITGRVPGVPFTFCPQPELRPDLEIQAVWIRARLEDNLILLRSQPNYEAHLAMAGMAEGGEALFRAWRYGDWEAFVGQVFKEWRRDLHIVGNDFHAPANWRAAAALDWGYRSPGCFLLFLSGPDGDVVAVEELYFKEIHAQEAGYQVGLMCVPYGQVEYIAADHDMWRMTGVSAPTLAEEFQLGLWQAYQDRRDLAPTLIEATKGRGSRHAKLVLMHRYLAWQETTLEDGSRTIQPWHRPRLRFMERCRASIRTIPALPYSETDPEDVDTEAEDHPYDAATIFLMSRPPLAERPERARERERHPGIDPRTKKRKRYREVGMEAPQGYEYAGTGYRMPREYVPLEED